MPEFFVKNLRDDSGCKSENSRVTVAMVMHGCKDGNFTVSRNKAIRNRITYACTFLCCFWMDLIVYPRPEVRISNGRGSIPAANKNAN